MEVQAYLAGIDVPVHFEGAREIATERSFTHQTATTDQPTVVELFSFHSNEDGARYALVGANWQHERVAFSSGLNGHGTDVGPLVGLPFNRIPVHDEVSDPRILPPFQVGVQGKGYPPVVQHPLAVLEYDSIVFPCRSIRMLNEETELVLPDVVWDAAVGCLYLPCSHLEFDGHFRRLALEIDDVALTIDL